MLVAIETLVRPNTTQQARRVRVYPGIRSNPGRILEEWPATRSTVGWRFEFYLDVEVADGAKKADVVRLLQIEQQGFADFLAQPECIADAQDVGKYSAANIGIEFDLQGYKNQGSQYYQNVYADCVAILQQAQLTTL